MDRQQRKLLQMLRRSGVMSAESLAAGLGVSTRTVRSYIRRANLSLGGAACIATVRGAGYELRVRDQAAFESLVRKGRARGAVPATSEERVVYLVDDLLNRNDWVTIEALAETLYVSRDTLTKDLRLVGDDCARFGLTLERRPHHGIRVTGAEMDKRLCLASVVTGGQGWELEAFDDPAMLNAIDACVSAIAQGKGVSIRGYAYRNLLVHMAIAIARIRQGSYVPMEPGQLETIRSGRTFSTARRMAAALGQRFDVELPESEVAYLAIHLAGKEDVSAGPDEGHNRYSIPSEVWDVVSRLVELVRIDFGYDFGDDLELRMNLARHIAPLSVRMRFNMQTSNPLLADIKAHYPVAYHIALDCAPVITHAWGAELTEDEIGYVALSFALALERRRTQAKRSNVLIVCTTGEGSARLLELRFREEFGSHIGTVVTCDISTVASQDLSDIDYVLTTVPIHLPLKVPVVEVGNFLEPSDVTHIRTLLDRTDAVDMRRYFDRDLFFSHLHLGSREEMIDFLCVRLAAHEGMGEGFTSSVWERERLAPTSFGNQIATPHPLEAQGERSLVVVGINDEPISWNGKPVRVALLVSLSRGPEDRQVFHHVMATFLTSRQDVKRLIRTQDFDDLMWMLERHGVSTTACGAGVSR